MNFIRPERGGRLVAVRGAGSLYLNDECPPSATHDRVANINTQFCLPDCYKTFSHELADLHSIAAAAVVAASATAAHPFVVIAVDIIADFAAAVAVAVLFLTVQAPRFFLEKTPVVSIPVKQ